jgi:hypothetical protein
MDWNRARGDGVHADVKLHFALASQLAQHVGRLSGSAMNENHAAIEHLYLMADVPPMIIPELDTQIQTNHLLNTYQNACAPSLDPIAGPRVNFSSFSVS